MSDGVGALADLVRNDESDFRIMVVDSVQEDGSVNLTYAGGIFNDVPANASYSPRAEGDVVLVLAQGQSWRVIDKVGSGAVEEEEDEEEPAVLTFGLAAPSSSWTLARAVYVRCV